MGTAVLTRGNQADPRSRITSYSSASSGFSRRDLRRCARLNQFLVGTSLVLVMITTSFMLEEMHCLTAVFPSTVPLQDKQDMTILVQLSGEFGNHLSKMAHGYGLQLWLRETNNQGQRQSQQQRLVMRHQGPRYVYKWEKAQEDLHRCFPWTRPYNVSQGYDDPVYNTYVQQYTSNRTSPLYQQWEELNQAQEINSVDPIFHRLIREHQDIQRERWLISDGEQEANSPFIVYSNQFVHANHFWMDRYYDEYRKAFKMESGCCPQDSQAPQPDETVVHFRNYLEEMPRKRLLSHSPFHEANPTTLANGLLGHLTPGVDKVALIGPTGGHRFRGNTSSVRDLLEAHKRVLEQRGIVTRIIDRGNGTDDNDMADFCFLIQAQKELVGLETSTFVYWAGILGQAQQVRLYSIDPLANDAPQINSNKTWPTNTVLQKRIRFETIRQIIQNQAATKSMQ